MFLVPPRLWVSVFVFIQSGTRPRCTRKRSVDLPPLILCLRDFFPTGWTDVFLSFGKCTFSVMFILSKTEKSV